MNEMSLLWRCTKNDYDISMSQSDEFLGRNGLSVGSLRLEGRAFLAPMAGVTDLGMRRLAQDFGAALTFSEMLDAEFYTRGDRQAAVRAQSAGINLHVVQIAGCRSQRLAEAARLAADSGAAMIDINMGCPAKRVTDGEAGSALMRDLDLAMQLVRAVVAAVKIPVSLKMRLGWDQAALNAPELARRAESEGIAMLTVHGRTRCQFYQGRADWTAIRKVREATSLPLVANGDCTSLDAARDMLRASGADAVMIGRAAMGRPWFVGQVARHIAHRPPFPSPSAEDRHVAAQQHYRTLLTIFGREKGMRQARKHLSAYAAHSQNRRADELRERLVRSENPAEVEALLGHLFEDERIAA